MPKRGVKTRINFIEALVEVAIAKVPSWRGVFRSWRRWPRDRTHASGDSIGTPEPNCPET
jgi:hypothetical protein